ncbi:MAG TPA: hypothetical protein VF074_09620 [Pyrinomonadaceae bacterium]
MNRNQKIALGCGSAGCLGLIVVAVAAGLVYYFSQRSFSLIPGENRNANINSNSNSNSSDSSADESATTLSDDDQHKLFHAASATRDTALMNRVWRKLGLTDADGTPNDKYAEFTKDHIGWLFRNADFLQEIDSEQKARAYVDAHIND